MQLPKGYSSRARWDPEVTPKQKTRIMTVWQIYWLLSFSSQCPVRFNNHIVIVWLIAQFGQDIFCLIFKHFGGFAWHRSSRAEDNIRISRVFRHRFVPAIWKPRAVSVYVLAISVEMSLTTLTGEVAEAFIISELVGSGKMLVGPGLEDGARSVRFLSFCSVLNMFSSRLFHPPTLSSIPKYH